MNKNLHLFLFLGLVIIILYLYKIESFGNQLIIPQFEFAILSPDQDINTGYIQEKICRDDPDWKKNNKTCRDYSLSGADCFELGDNNKTAFESCLVSCDNCPSSIRIKRKEKSRDPSPVEDVQEPPYSVFEEYEGGTFGGASGIEILNRLNELDEKIDIISGIKNTNICNNISNQNGHDSFSDGIGSTGHFTTNTYIKWYFSHIFQNININYTDSENQIPGNIRDSEQINELAERGHLQINIDQENSNLILHHGPHKIRDISYIMGEVTLSGQGGGDNNQLLQSMQTDMRRHPNFYNVINPFIILSRELIINNPRESILRLPSIEAGCSTSRSCPVVFRDLDAFIITIYFIIMYLFNGAFNIFKSSNPDYNGPISIQFTEPCSTISLSDLLGITNIIKSPEQQIQEGQPEEWTIDIDKANQVIALFTCNITITPCQ